MSFQSNVTNAEIGLQIIEASMKNQRSAFEHHIMQCCKQPEWELRKWLHKVLTRAGFEIFEDKYRTERCSKEPLYETVHNMLAIRGNPNVCLVAHTDVCRDHNEVRSGFQEEMWEKFVAQYGGDKKIMRRFGPRKVDPVIKVVEDGGVIRRIIQDRECAIQVGGDDRLGVAINTWIALNTGYDLGLYFPTDEEIGLKSARACEMTRLKEFDLLIETDRGNHSNELVTKIGSTVLSQYDTVSRLLEIAFNLGPEYRRYPVTGMGTDVAALKDRGMCKEAINMTVGYHNSHGSGPDEYIDCAEARKSMIFVNAVVRDYFLYPHT